MASAATVLITGASSGIGLELARICAAHGHPLILVARGREQLLYLAGQLREQHAVTVHVLPMDLGAPEAAAALAAQLQEQAWRVEMLINNAGFGTYGLFARSDLAEETRMMQLNMVALTQLTRLLLPPMLERGRGRILNVASTAAFQPGPLMAVYYASKAYVLSFSEALSNELQGTGVTVTALCPGPTTSAFQERAGIQHTRLVRRRIMDAATVARVGYAGMMRGQRVVIPGLRNYLLALGSRLMPHRIVLPIVRWLQEQKTAAS